MTRLAAMLAMAACLAAPAAAQFRPGAPSYSPETEVALAKARGAGPVSPSVLSS